MSVFVRTAGGAAIRLDAIVSVDVQPGPEFKEPPAVRWVLVARQAFELPHVRTDPVVTISGRLLDVSTGVARPDAFDWFTDYVTRQDDLGSPVNVFAIEAV